MSSEYVTEDGHRHVTIHAPIAMAVGQSEILSQPELAPEDVIRMQNVENQQLRRELRELKITASTIANVAICLAKMLEDKGLSKQIPRWLSDQMMGANITVYETEKGGDIAVNIRERGEFPVEIDQ